jgi:hypothetical protein
MLVIGVQMLMLLVILVKVVGGLDVWQDVCKCGLCRKRCVRHGVKRKMERISSGGIELTEMENT